MKKDRVAPLQLQYMYIKLKANKNGGLISIRPMLEQLRPFRFLHKKIFQFINMEINSFCKINIALILHEAFAQVIKASIDVCSFNAFNRVSFK